MNPGNALRFFVLSLCVAVQPVLSQVTDFDQARVVIPNDGWELVGDLIIPESDDAVPAVLMLNKAAGDRWAYSKLAEQLSKRGVASLRLDLRGHGESTNRGRFVPGERERSPMIWDSEVDVIAAHEYLKAQNGIDALRIAIVGASYSGEEMAEAGRINGYAQAYVALSPGSFSDESIAAIDTSGVPWLFIVSRDERFLREITASVREQSRTVELGIVPGTRHASDILEAHPHMAERIAVWLAHQLK